MTIIYISGIDGCGKTTQAKLLVDKLIDKGLNVEYKWLRWEPSLRNIINYFRLIKANTSGADNASSVESENAEYGRWLKLKRTLLANTLIRRLWLFYACSDYYMAYRRRFPKIISDIIVVDRYLDDFIIDQAVNLNIDHKKINLIKDNFFLKKIHSPNYNIIIDLPAMEGYKRKCDGTPLYYLKVREKYYGQIAGNNTLHLNGREEIESLSRKIKGWVFNKLGVVG